MAEKKNEVGKLQIAPGVLELIIGLAATEVPGVSRLSGSVVSGIADWLKKKGPTKGVKVSADGIKLIIDVHITVEYGCAMHEVAAKVQARVKKAVESMTDRKAGSVNVYVDGVTFPTEK